MIWIVVVENQKYNKWSQLTKQGASITPIHQLSATVSLPTKRISILFILCLSQPTIITSRASLLQINIQPVCSHLSSKSTKFCFLLHSIFHLIILFKSHTIILRYNNLQLESWLKSRFQILVTNKFYFIHFFFLTINNLKSRSCFLF